MEWVIVGEMYVFEELLPEYSRGYYHGHNNANNNNNDCGDVDEP